MVLRASLVLSGDASGANAALDGLEKNMTSAEAEAAKLAAAYDRVDVAIDKLAKAQSAAAIEISVAKADFDACKITIDEYNRRLLEANTALGLVKTQHGAAVGALKQAQSALSSAGASAGQARAGYQNFGRQVQDVAVQLQGGANIGTIIAQQGGQVADAIAQMGGKFSGFATFLAGPWGAAIILGVSALANLAQAMWTAGNASDDHEQSAEELTKALDDLHKATVRESQSTWASIQADIDKANALRLRAQEARKATIAELQLAKQRVETANAAAVGGRSANYGGNYIAQNAERDVGSIEAQIKAMNAQIGVAEGDIRLKRAKQIGVEVKASLDGAAGAALRYDRAIDRLNVRLQAGRISEIQYREAITAAMRTRDAETEAAKQSTRSHHANGDAKRAAAAAARQAASAAREHAKAEQQLATAIERGNFAFAQRMARLAEQSGSLAPGILGFEPPKQVTVASQIEELARDAAARTAQQFPEQKPGYLADALRDLNDKGRRGREMAEAITIPLTSTLDELLGSKFFTRLGDAFSGAVEGYLTAGPIGGILGGLKEVKSVSRLMDELSGRQDVLGKALMGAKTGSLVSGLADSIGVKLSTTGSQIGGAIGTFLPIPGGDVIGALAGGILGSLFGKKHALSRAYVSNTTVDTWSRRADTDAVTNAGNSIQDAIQKIADQLGGRVGNYGVTIGTWDDEYRVHGDYGADTVAKNPGGLIYRGKNPEMALAAAIGNAISDGAVQGISAKVAAALKSSDDIDKAVQEAIKVQDLEGLLGGVAGSLRKELKAFEDTAAERVRLARRYGFSLVEVEKVNAEERLKLAEKLADQQVGSLKQLIDDMTFGNLFEGTGLDRRQLLLDQIASAKTQADQGVEGAADKLSSLLSDFAAVSKDVYGTTGGYAGDRSMILDAARDSVAKANQRIAAAQAAVSSSDPALATTNAALDENNAQNAQMIAMLQAIGINLGNLKFGPANLSALQVAAAI